MSEADLQRMVKQAEKIAMKVHESVRGAAFNSILNILMQQSGIGSATRDNQRAPRISQRASKASDSPEDVVAILMQMDGTAYPKVRTASRVLDRSLNVLRIAKDDFQIDGLGATQIAKVLTDKFRLTTKDSAVRMALDRAGDKVDRVVLNKNAIRYCIMAPGEDYLDNSSEKNSSKPVTKPSTRSKAVATQKTGAKKETANAKISSSKKRSGRPGPKAALSELASTGFFKSAKTISDIQSQLEEKQGYRYKSTELSPALVRLLRDDVIDRGKNSDGQYEYTSK